MQFRFSSTFLISLLFSFSISSKTYAETAHQIIPPSSQSELQLSSPQTLNNLSAKLYDKNRAVQLEAIRKLSELTDRTAVNKELERFIKSPQCDTPELRHHALAVQIANDEFIGRGEGVMPQPTPIIGLK